MKEKASPSKRPRRSAKGTVLFTVVSVMMVLIVFLMGTLALAATANKRAQRNYQKEQSEYTARAVMDAVIAKINEDTTGTGLKRDIADGTVSSLTVTVKDADNNSFNQTVDIEKLADATGSDLTRPIYTGAADGWKDVPLYQLTIRMNSNTTSADTTYTALVTAGLHTSTNGSGSGSGGGGAFVSMGDLTTEIGTGGYITGGSYVGLGNTTMNDFHVGDSGNSTIDAPMYVNGNLSIKNGFTFHFSTSEQFLAIMGNFQPAQEYGIVCDYEGYTSTDTSYENIPKIYAGGTIKFGIDPEDNTGTNTPYQIGSATVPTNVFAGRFVFTTTNHDVTNPSYIYGDIYGFDPTKTNYISAPDNVTLPLLYKWATSNIKDKNNVNRYFGNIYSAGNLKLNTNGNGLLEVQGDVRCAKDVVVGGGGATVDGDLVVAGTLTVNSPLTAANIYATKIINNSTISCTSAHAFETEGTVNNYTQFTGGRRVIGSAQVTRTVKYENIALSQYLVNGNTAGEAVLTYDTVTTTVRKVGGVETPLGDERVPTRTQINSWYIPYPDNATYTNMQSYIDAGKWADYEALKTTYNTLVAATPTTTTTNEDIVEYDFGAVYTGVVYPSDYTMDKMPGAVFTVPEANKYRSNYFTKVDGTPGYGNSLVDTSNNYVPTIYTNDSYTIHTAANGRQDYFLEVTNTCVLSGTMNKGNIYINPGPNHPITVVLDNFTMNEGGKGFGSINGGGKIMMIVNDQSQVTFFVRGNCSLECEGLITQDYLEMFTGQIDPTAAESAVTHYTKDEIAKFRGIDESSGSILSEHLRIPQEVDTSDEIESRFLPDVVIYGEAPDAAKGINRSKLSLDGNNVVLTAQVRAPEMDFHQNMGKTATITYVKPNLQTATPAEKLYGTGYNTHIGVIGQLIANKITLGDSARWGLIYVTEPDSRCAACKAAGCTACTGDSTCTCTESTCTCHTGTPTPPAPAGSIDYAENFNVLYYNVY